MPLPDISPLPTPPQRDDDPDVFVERADDFVASLPQLVTQINALAEALEATAALIAAAPAYADPGLLALTGQTPAADRLLYFTGANTSALATLTAFARSFLNDTDADEALATLGLTEAGQALVRLESYAAMRTELSLYTKAQVDAAVEAAAAAAVPAGTVITVARDSAPTGYLKCNGALVSRATYAALFSAIGTTYGAGDGATTFQLPDLRGQFVRGWSDDGATDAGRTLGSSQADELKSHTHGVRAFTRNIDGSSNEGEAVLKMTSGFNSAYVESVGGTETRPVNVALLYCIKA